MRESERHELYMRRALELARQGTGRTHPNPLVGAVVVADGRIVGEGAHLQAGGAHAEATALAEAGALARGADLYVTLEPCNHDGRTPPCTAAILHAGIRRVYFAVGDPNPNVAGGGADFLRNRGVACVAGPLKDEAVYLNRGFFRWTRFKRPWVIAKFAASLDGRVATRTGESKWITGPESRLRAHELRGQVDAILVGSGTVIADDPRLTVRVAEKDGVTGTRTDVLRVVVDSRGRSPLDAVAFRPAPGAPTFVATTSRSPEPWRARLAEHGVDVVVLPSDPDGHADINALLDELGERHVRTLLIEGGPTIHGAFFDARRVDEVWAFLAPAIIGGNSATPAVAGAGNASLNEALRLANVHIERCGDDVLVRGTLSPPFAVPVFESEETCSQES